MMYLVAYYLNCWLFQPILQSRFLSRSWIEVTQWILQLWFQEVAEIWISSCANWNWLLLCCLSYIVFTWFLCMCYTWQFVYYVMWSSAEAIYVVCVADLSCGILHNSFHVTCIYSIYRYLSSGTVYNFQEVLHQHRRACQHQYSEIVVLLLNLFSVAIISQVILHSSHLRLMM